MPQYLKTRLRDAAVILGIAAMLTFFGVYDHDSPVWVRFLMWVVTCAVGITTAEFVAPAVFVREIVGKLVPVKVAITAAIISVPVLLSDFRLIVYRTGTKTLHGRLIKYR